MSDTAQQIELSLKARGQRQERAPRVKSEEIGLLLNILRGRGWLHAEEIGRDYRFVAFYGAAIPQEPARRAQWMERKVRAMASLSGAQVLSYPGSPGYKLTLEATPKEMEDARVLWRQARAMQKRYVMLLRVWRGAVRL